MSSDDLGSLKAFCLDPNETTSFLRDVKGVVHMSGTMQPLRQYADILDLPENRELRIFPSPFPPENRLVLYAEDVSAGQREMRDDPSMKGRIEDHIINICQATDRNTMVFFRSYEMLRPCAPDRGMRRSPALLGGVRSVPPAGIEHPGLQARPRRGVLHCNGR